MRSFTGFLTSARSPVPNLIMRLLLLLFTAPFWTAAAAETLSKDQEEGRALAAEMRALRPVESFTNRAHLRLRDYIGRIQRVPLTIINRVTDDDAWQVEYQTTGPTNTTVVVTRHPEQSPRFVVDGQPRPEAEVQGFAGSDFSLGELGLAFLHWPEQRIVRRERPEMRKGRACRILESINPGVPGPARVRSWVDLEHKGLLLAEAYDDSGRLAKRFSIGSLRKIEGVWQLRDMEMIDEIRGTETKLEFELKAREPQP